MSIAEYLSMRYTVVRQVLSLRLCLYVCMYVCVYVCMCVYNGFTGEVYQFVYPAAMSALHGKVEDSRLG